MINHLISECKDSIRQDTTGRSRQSLGIVQEIEIWPYKQMVYAQPRIHPRKWVAQKFLWFWDTNMSSYLGPTTRTSDSQQQEQQQQQQKDNLPNSEFAVPADHRV